ncbi:MAG: hypothetical protein A4E62_01755 [Syntrophorhabdus sp. PtaU1.Bin002]|nr:MAG: hypothetical protein A4E58_01579 [Syntrophorhabdus sp. PtaB.Bin006]OPY69701.1 MAG: hypothetical protein A4E62_01755 [Syntrophorhabdus sp. PtaU1.Bin002]
MLTESLKDIINCVGNPIFLKDQQHRYVFANDTACEVVGIPHNALFVW